MSGRHLIPCIFCLFMRDDIRGDIKNAYRLLWGKTWAKTKAWDKAHSNRFEIRDREADLDGIKHAFETYKTDRAAAFVLYRQLAEQGSVWSMFDVARAYETGNGVEQDPGRAWEWFQRAFAGGCQCAMLECARYAYWRGDYAACQAILQVGVDQKWAPAIFWMAWYRYKQSDSRKTCRSIRPLLEDAARQGHPAAELLLTNLMSQGRYGLLDRVRGMKLALRAGRQLEADEAVSANPAM